MQRITAYLVEDHGRLEALHGAATARAGAIDREAFASFRAGLLRHIAVEEKILLPAARRANAGTPLSRARALRVEHAAITSLLVPTPDPALCAELYDLIVRHDAVEEGPCGVYEECERLFTLAESGALLAEARAYPAVRVAPHFDGPGVYRTAEAALAAAARLTHDPRSP